MMINRDENKEEEGAGEKNAQEASGRVCQAQHMKAWCTSVCRMRQRSGREEIKTDTKPRIVQRRFIDSLRCWMGLQINASLKLFNKPIGL